MIDDCSSLDFDFLEQHNAEELPSHLLVFRTLKPIFAHEVMKMSPSSMRYATFMEPAQFLIIKAEALTKSLGP